MQVDNGEFVGAEQDFPFRQRDHIRRLLLRLGDLGILSLLPSETPDSLRIASAGSGALASTSLNSTSAVEATGWQPSDALLDILSLKHGIDREFALSQLLDFDQGDAKTREARFRHRVLKYGARKPSTMRLIFRRLRILISTGNP